MSHSGGFDRQDFDLLQRIGEDDSGTSAGEQADKLWSRTRTLVAALARQTFGDDAVVALWAEHDVAERGPFLWARMKRPAHADFATHIGVFLSPGFCNLSIDLEKDPLDAGESAETLDQVIEFFRDGAGDLIDPPARPDLRIWTDTENVIPAAGFADVDFDAFMQANRDRGHPWPNAGYLLSADEVIGFGDHWVAECQARAVVLVPIYDAMIDSVAG